MPRLATCTNITSNTNEPLVSFDSCWKDHFESEPNEWRGKWRNKWRGEYVIGMLVIRLATHTNG